jgi:Peroxidase
MMRLVSFLVALRSCPSISLGFQHVVSRTASARIDQPLSALGMDRRGFGETLAATAATAGLGWLVAPVSPAAAQVFFDPAMYGDQELRVGAVDSVRESVRRAILKNPQIAPSFYQLALLDGLSYNAATNDFGPDGSILKLLFATKDDSPYVNNLREAALALIEAEKALRQKNAISLPDAIAIAGAEAIESIGGPVLTVQLGRADTPKTGPVNTNLPLDLFTGKHSSAEVVAAFRSAGLTEREMTALLTGLMTLEIVEKARSVDDWKTSSRPKFREAGKMGRMSEFKRLTDEDIAEAELRDDPEFEDPDDGWYIADSFGSRETRFGERLAKEDLTEKTFNKFLQELTDANRKKGDLAKYGWVGALVVDPNVPTAQTWLQKYAASNLNYVKDLNTAFNSITQLGAVYTGGKYENLLKNRPRKSLNDDDIKLF